MKTLLCLHKGANQRNHRVSRFQVGAALLLVILTGCSTAPRHEHIEKGLDISTYWSIKYGGPNSIW